MDPLSIIASTIAIIHAISSAYTAIQHVKGLPKTFVEVNHSLPLVLDTLTQAETRLSTLHNGLDESSRRAIEPVITTCKEKAKALLEIFQEVNNGKKGSALESYLVLRFGKANQVDTLMQDILRSLKLLGINQLFNTATHAQVSKLEEAIDRLSLGAHDMSAGPRRAILKALFSSPYLDRKNRNPDRVPGTCQWFVDHQLFRQWRESTSSSMLWVSADPGCGKSVLAKHLVDFELPTTISRTTCYFFFKDDFEDQKSAKSAIRCILHQLFTQKEALFSSEIVKRFESREVHLSDSFDEIWEVLLLASQDRDAGEIVCILDAFDECEDREQAMLARALCKFYGNAKTNTFNLKFLITSRPHGNIRRGFQPLNIPELPVVHLSGESEVEASKIAQEIDFYIKARVRSIRDLLNLSSDEEELLLQGVLRVPNRTYLWVYLTLDLIQGDIDINRGGIRNAVSRLPSTVDDAYEKILNRSTDFKEAKKLLHMVVAAARPLTVAEMSVALAVQPNHRSYKDLDLKSDARFREHARDLCGLFITIIGSKIYLLHQTAREFLVPADPSKSHGNELLWKFSLQPQESHRILTHVCVWYLLFNEFETLSSDNQHLDSRYIFLDYSAKHWASHSRATGVADDSITGSMLAICDAQTNRCQTWFRVFWSDLKTDLPRNLTALMIASYFGLESVVRLLLKEGVVEVNSVDAIYRRSALSWSSENGYDGVVRLLIKGPKFNLRHLKPSVRKDRKDQLDAKDIYGRTPLSYAAWNGHAAIVKQLVKAGASVDSRDEIGLTPLSYALCNGHEAVVSQLAKGAPTESVDRTRETLLFSAVENNRDDIVKQLLDNGTNIEAVDEVGDTPLHRASYHSRKAIVRLLLSHGANIEVVDKRGSTPLLMASREGNGSIVQLFLDENANIEATNKDGDTPLLSAAGNGHEGIVRLLLDNGANIEMIENISGATPLFVATYRGSEDVVRLLLDRGANTEVVNILGRTPLLGAASDGHEGVMRLLLDRGANTAFVDKKGKSALDVAAKRKHEAIVQMLRRHGAPCGHEVAAPLLE